MKLLVATRNQGKVAEFADMLADLQVDWLGLDDIGIMLEVAETGTTFEHNAILKAAAFARASGLLTLADDSGLEVDALDGKPGVHTARFGGPGLTSVERYGVLLNELREIPWSGRSARFRCVIALAEPQQVLGTASGVCEGMIAVAPAGDGGFGYDPIFYLPEYQKTMAQLPPEQKNRISHRGRAIVAITPLLKQTLGRR